MTRSPRSLLAAAALGAVLLTACGDNSAVRPGSAAVVGGERITVSALEDLVARSLTDEAEAAGIDRVAVQRELLSRLIGTRVLDEAAAAADVSVTDGEVDALLDSFVDQAGSREALDTQAAEGGIAAEDVRAYVRELALREALGDELTREAQVTPAQLQEAYDAQLARYDQVRTAHILVADEAQARDLLAQVQEDPSRFAALAEEFSTDTGSAAMGGDLGFAGRGQFVPPFEEAAFGAEVGDVVLANTEFGWHVIRVDERLTTSLQEAEPELRRAILGTDRDAAVQEALRAAADELGVTVNPRFGAFDPETVSVVAAPAGEDDATVDDGAVDDGAVDPGTDPGQPVPGGDPGAPVPGAPVPPAGGDVPVAPSG